MVLVDVKVIETKRALFWGSSGLANPDSIASIISLTLLALLGSMSFGIAMLRPTRPKFVEKSSCCVK